MAISWSDFPHRELMLEIHSRQRKAAIERSSEDTERHILKRRLAELVPEHHRSYIRAEAHDVVRLLRCTRDVYREYVEDNQCTPLSEAYWVILRLAILPTAISALRDKVFEYLSSFNILALKLSLLFGVQTRARSLDFKFERRIDEERIPADRSEIGAVATLVNEDTLLWLEERRVGHPFGGGPYAIDDVLAIERSWGLGALHSGITLLEWASLRERLWRACAPWTEGLTTLFRCAQDELMAQWQALPADAGSRELVKLKGAQDSVVVPLLANTNLQKRKKKAPSRVSKLRGRKSVISESRYRAIRSVSADGVQGAEYCRRLDAHLQQSLGSQTTPPEWRLEGCPNTYYQAYTDPDLDKRKRWQNRIHNQKHKATRRPDSPNTRH